MKTFVKRGKCYCGGPESCNLCRPDKIKKRANKKRVRSLIKNVLKQQRRNNEI